MLTRCAWAAAIVLCTTAVLFWPLQTTPTAVVFVLSAWALRRVIGLSAPLGLIAVFCTVPFLFAPYEPQRPALTPNPIRVDDKYLPVYSWLTNHDPYVHGLLLPVLLIAVPTLLVVVLVYAYRTGPR